MECSKCGSRRGRGRCLDCHAARMRAWRKTHPLTPAQRLKDTARSYAGVYLRRGKLNKPAVCGRCAGPNPQMHHPDYAEPLLVEWLCRSCHLAVHAE